MLKSAASLSASTVVSLYSQLPRADGPLFISSPSFSSQPPSSNDDVKSLLNANTVPSMLKWSLLFDSLSVVAMVFTIFLSNEMISKIALTLLAFVYVVFICFTVLIFRSCENLHSVSFSQVSRVYGLFFRTLEQSKTYRHVGYLCQSISQLQGWCSSTFSPPVSFTIRDSLRSQKKR